MKTIEVSCENIADLIIEQTDCQDCPLDGCPCGSGCEYTDKCPYICGNMKYKRELENDHEKLCEWLENHAEEIEQYPPQVAADVIRKLKTEIEQLKAGMPSEKA